MRTKATIRFRMLSTHPDKDCVVGGWNPKKEYEYSDTYTFDSTYRYTKEEREAYMKKDLALVAGGGYNDDHITITGYSFD